MRKKKPYKILEERLKSNHIVIQLFKRRKVFSFGLSTFIGDGGMGHPEGGVYRSCFEAKNAALRRIKQYHHSPLQKALLSKFRIMKDIDQPYLFDDLY
jgi:hypothetical protein